MSSISHEFLELATGGGGDRLAGVACGRAFAGRKTRSNKR